MLGVCAYKIVHNHHLQRWLNKDPIGEAGGVNLFGFVLNQPLVLVDPYGEAPDAPDPWPPVPEDVKKYCVKSTVNDGFKALNELYANAVQKLKDLGITPAPYGKDGASCLNSSHEILASFFSSGKFPKCWACRVEGRRGHFSIGQHAAIVCRSFSKDGSPSQSVLFDWWGDQHNGTANSGGTPDSFYNKYPNNSGPYSGVQWQPPYYTSGTGGMWQNQHGIPSHPPVPPNWGSLIPQHN